jgi:hypothetical protein
VSSSTLPAIPFSVSLEDNNTGGNEMTKSVKQRVGELEQGLIALNKEMLNFAEAVGKSEKQARLDQWKVIGGFKGRQSDLEARQSVLHARMGSILERIVRLENDANAEPKEPQPYNFRFTMYNTKTGEETAPEAEEPTDYYNNPVAVDDRVQITIPPFGSDSILTLKYDPRYKGWFATFSDLPDTTINTRCLVKASHEAKTATQIEEEAASVEPSPVLDKNGVEITVGAKCNVICDGKVVYTGNVISTERDKDVTCVHDICIKLDDGNGIYVETKLVEVIDPEPTPEGIALDQMVEDYKNLTEQPEPEACPNCNNERWVSETTPCPKCNGNKYHPYESCRVYSFGESQPEAKPQPIGKDSDGKYCYEDDVLLTSHGLESKPNIAHLKSIRADGWFILVDVCGDERWWYPDRCTLIAPGPNNPNFKCGK